MVKVTAGRVVFTFYSLALSLFGVSAAATLVDTIRNNMRNPFLSTSLGLSVMWAALIFTIAGMFIARLAIRPSPGRRSPIKGVWPVWVLFCLAFLSNAFLFNYNSVSFYYLKVGLELIALVSFCAIGVMVFREFRRKYYVVRH